MQRVVAGLPKSYPHQVGLTCGETNAKSVIASFGVPYRPFRSSIWVRLFGYSLLNDLRQLLQAHCLSATIGQAGELDDASKIDALRRHIDHGSPVILSIANGYRRRGHYLPWARLLVGHYATVYGYDDAQQVSTSTTHIFEEIRIRHPRSDADVEQRCGSLTSVVNRGKGGQFVTKFSDERHWTGQESAPHNSR